MTGTPKISVVVPVYNCAPWLERCLDSLLAQTMEDIEIIAVNNGSTDGSERILRAYAKRDRRIRIITQENLGTMGSRNTGLNSAGGEYLSFVDADDYVERDYCARLLERIEATASDIAICDYFLDYPGRADRGVLSLKEQEVRFGDCGPGLLFLRWFARNPVVWNKLYRMKWLKSTGVEFEVQHGEDLLFHLRLLPSVRKICTLPASLYHYVQRADSLMHGRDKSMQDSVSLLECFLQSKTDEPADARLCYFAFSSIFTGFMFSNFVVDRPRSYFRRQVEILRRAPFFAGYCETISRTEKLAPLYEEGAITKRFYRIQKMLFGFCRRGRDRAAGDFMWLCAKLIVAKKRSLPLTRGEVQR